MCWGASVNTHENAHVKKAQMNILTDSMRRLLGVAGIPNATLCAKPALPNPQRCSGRIDVVHQKVSAAPAPRQLHQWLRRTRAKLQQKPHQLRCTPSHDHVLGRSAETAPCVLFETRDHLHCAVTNGNVEHRAAHHALTDGSWKMSSTTPHKVLWCSDKRLPSGMSPKRSGPYSLTAPLEDSSDRATSYDRAPRQTHRGAEPFASMKRGPTPSKTSRTCTSSLKVFAWRSSCLPHAGGLQTWLPRRAP